mmetsp:Transcript_143/g.178  ORF Transcript_143/g.178 Transcript_143/m.178 type:complete len:178 (-) Transcript_143:254-787(-)|eukprot:CAMPEP_0175093658 /NCGR_PEP_ID=MMETSP0086_2-20121207/3144_1 /TAXON_ID=136419 /ORGANISM="Unknown Unknown, Strain D1" /LENGTH=177 /DNA_ID=CAMNT_0016366663 /DNA_START=31 /DNA_END=564 /DNA_ORIENTATION=-
MSSPPQLSPRASSVVENTFQQFFGAALKEDANKAIPKLMAQAPVNFDHRSNLWDDYSSAINFAEGDQGLIDRINRRQMTRLYFVHFQQRMCSTQKATFLSCIRKAGNPDTCAVDNANWQNCNQYQENRAFRECGENLKYLSNSMDETGKFNEAYMYGFEKCMKELGGAPFFKWDKQI